MKKIIFVFLLIFCAGSIFSMDKEELLKLRKDFISAGIDVKLMILRSISQSEDEGLIPVYKDAVEYVKNSYDILKNDPRLLNIGIISVTKLGELNEIKSSGSIRYLFSTVENEDFQIACLKSLSRLIQQDSAFTDYLNSLYEAGLSDLISGKTFSVNLLSVYAEVLGNFADPSSFNILIKTLFYPVSDNLKDTVKTALNNISFNYFDEILAKTGEKNIQYIWTLYLLAKENKRLDSTELGRISELIVDYGLKNLQDADAESAENLIEAALPVLSELKWSKASPQVNKFFYYAQGLRKSTNRVNDLLISIIDCMGNLGTIECSQNLSIFLGVLNSETEKTKQYDEPLVLSVITALRKLGDKTAFDYLLYVEYLNYSKTVKQASRNAIEELKW
ncbi:hypothetical protein [Treponema putidum]|uniref:HEAT repeat protein n=1 Tax=Treponema putidum TaxID=221027 RepID=A0AAE9MVN9_9SPIR|nr:hypothetical protein [Treponema putidum]AIN94725.1 hypothetical protein JO40_12070 [Treponema putidum]TWI77596.1 hypothetical protein JM98_01290 [Treponema putidum]UTY28745.1 hypothetical protein E4N76_06850 [Treponema putidum]UTY31175.1 hypothetical protein E4N75_06285 [Treponema putidum]UTY33612.1 hypothetical protein E4N74_05950 [Treponema putidum]